MPDTPGTLNFPTSLDTAVSLFEVSNRAYTTMTGSIGTGDLSIGVANGSLLPSTGAVTLVDSLTAPTKVEHIIYTVNSSNTLTVPAGGRAFGGSTAQSWSGTVYVRARALAQHHSVLRGGVIALETKLGINSSTPSSGTVLRGTGAGASDWGALVNADVSASAAIAMSKLAALTASRAVITDVSGVLSAATTTSTEIGYLNGVTSAIQTQIDGKQASDADLTAIAGLSPSNDDIIQRKTGAWTNRTPTQLTADLIAFTGDSGSGGVKGLVPAPAAGDAAASKFLKADGTWATAGGGGLTVGTTAIASGTAGRFLYETSGNVLGEVSTLTSDGTILTFSPTVTTGTGATAGLNANANSLTTGDAFNFASSSVTSGNVFKISATGTAATSNTKTALNVATSGANGTSTQTTYGGRFANTSTGTSSTNVGVYATASGGSTNYSIQTAAGDAEMSGGDILVGTGQFTSRLIGNAQAGVGSFTGIGVLNGSAGSRTLRAGMNVNGDNIRFASNSSYRYAFNDGTGLQLASAYGVLFNSATDLTSGSSDAGMFRLAAGQIRFTNASTGIGSVLIGTSSDSITGNFTVMASNAATNSIVDIARLGVNSTGTAAAGFGGRLSLSLESSTTADTLAGTHGWYWSDATHASRTSYQSFSVVGNAVTHEILRLQGGASGTPATALQITSAAAGSGVTLTALSSGTNESIYLAPKGTGTIRPAVAAVNAVFYAVDTTADTGIGRGSVGSQGVYFRVAGVASGDWRNEGIFLISSSGAYGFYNGSYGSTVDLRMVQSAASVLRIANGSTGAGGILVAPSSATITGSFTVLPDNAATNSIVDIARLGVNSTGTAASGFGGRLSFSAETSTTNDTRAGHLEWQWATATHASRAGRITAFVEDSGGTREGWRIEGSGSAALIGFLGATAVARQAVGAAASDAATTQTLANNLRTALINLGLCTT